MTEEAWLACGDPGPLLQELQQRRGSRKDWRRFWLFSCACCRSIWHLLEDARCRKVVDAGEQYADGECSYEQLMEASEQAYCMRTDLVTGSLDEAAALATFPVVVDPSYADNMTPRPPAENAGYTTQEVVEVLNRYLATGTSELRPERDRIIADTRIAQAGLLRCIFGNPFRPVTLTPSHRTPTVVSLARAAYDERQLPSGELYPDRLAVLADALEETGAPDELVAHLRGPGPHVRGCFAVDLCLGLS